MNFLDQLDRAIFIPSPPERIISLVPSQTELLVDMGLQDRLVGITKFCVHPKELKKEKVIIGGTKNYRFDVIDQLKPDLIIGNKEENDQSGIEQLMKKYSVWMSDISTLEDNLKMIKSLGEIFRVEGSAHTIIKKIESDFFEKAPRKGKIVYLIWNDPIMTAGTKTFINEMLQWAGFENMIAQARYPEISIEELKELKPDFLFLSSEPFPFGAKHLEAYQKLLPNTVVKLVDGEYFSWYGSRLLGAKEYFSTLYLDL